MSLRNTEVPQTTTDAVAQKVWRLEALLDEALVVASGLTADIARGRMEVGLCATVGHEQVFASLPAISSAIVVARGNTVDVHKGLQIMARKMNLITMSPPPNKDEKSEDFTPFGVANASLPRTVVALPRSAAAA